MTSVVRVLLVAMFLTVPLACSQTESGRGTSSTASNEVSEESSRIIPESRSTSKTDGAGNASTRNNQEIQSSDQPRDKRDIAKPRSTTRSDQSGQPVGGSQAPIEPDKPNEANWESTNERDQVDVRQERLNAARKKLRALSRKQKKQRKLHSRQAKKYQQQALNRLERHMNKRGWKNFSMGEPSSENEGTAERSGADQDRERE